MVKERSQNRVWRLQVCWIFLGPFFFLWRFVGISSRSGSTVEQKVQLCIERKVDAHGVGPFGCLSRTTVVQDVIDRHHQCDYALCQRQVVHNM